MAFLTESYGPDLLDNTGQPATAGTIVDELRFSFTTDGLVTCWRWSGSAWVGAQMGIPISTVGDPNFGVSTEESSITLLVDNSSPGLWYSSTNNSNSAWTALIGAGGGY